MNPEAEKLRSAMWHVRGVSDEHRWLQDNADTVAELVDAAMEVSQYNHPGTHAPARLRRLARAVVDFKGPQEPPEPQRESIEMLLCPEDGCKWARYTHSREASDAMEHYRRHYHTDHGGRP